MRYFLLGVCAILLSVDYSQGVNTLPAATKTKYETYLKAFNNSRGHIPNTPKLDANRNSVRAFMKTKFEAAGLEVHMQDFSTTVTNYGKAANGTNLIAILKGDNYGKPEDEIIILAAHLDTPKRDAGGLNNDGSGLVGLLTIAEALKDKDLCSQRNSSVIFAAFDRSETDEIGGQITQCNKSCGSVEFIKNKAKYISKGSIKLVMVLDCIANFNSGTDSQKFPAAMSTYFSLFVQTSQYSDSKGNFLAFSGRNNEKAYLDELKTTYDASKVLPQTDEFSGEKFQWEINGKLTPNNATEINKVFKEGDQISFWDADINTVLITDTCYSRVPLANANCKLEPTCDVIEKLDDDDYKFLYSALSTVTKFTNKHTCGGVCAACDVNADCKNNTCVCKAGFSGNGEKCTDIDECKQLGICSKHATCKNTPGSYNCNCKDGFTGTGKMCTAITSSASVLQVIPQVIVFGLAMLLSYFRN